MIPKSGNRFSEKSMLQLMRGQPLTGGVLRRRDFLIRHLGREFAATLDRRAVAARGREIEPLMRGDTIDRRGAARRKHDAELKKDVAGRVPLPRGGGLQRSNFVARHLTSPRSPGGPFRRPLRDEDCPADLNLILSSWLN